MTDAPHENRLARERSPYLLQHAKNPVDWHPWGDEAFEKARREDKPVFLSVGYSACHWCHVMEHESFEDEDTAQVLNEHFVSVKVDREERPDVDQTYQLAHQLLSQRGGGWPLSMFLTPERKPFYGGTYFPNRPRYGMPSFVDLLHGLVNAWKTRREDVFAQADELTHHLAHVGVAQSAKSSDAKGVDTLAEAAKRVLHRVDMARGGVGRAPKFPNTMSLDLLVGAAALSLAGVADGAREALSVTLDHMARGGIWDHLGGGFARYSTDEHWKVPHFEKMLYDNAQLARLYLDGSRLLGGEAAERHREVVASIFTYVAREMTSPEGVFYSAQDADSEGEEGRFFVWTPAEIEAVVGKDDAALVGAFYDVTAEGNFEHGRSVLWTPRTLDAVARTVGRAPDAVRAAVERSRPKLFDAREQRPKPLRDDKCLAGWNALMIGALADAGATLGRDEWLSAATRALDVWRTRAWKDGRLAHAMKHGEPYGTGFLDDYAGLACAAVDVYEATFDATALAFARELVASAVELFHDPASGTFFFSPSDAEVVLYRSREPFDHAYPGGMGLMLDALLRVGELTGDTSLHDLASRAAAVLGPTARENPIGMASVTRAVDRALRGAIEVVVMGDRAREDTRAMLGVARSRAIPHRVLISARDGDEGVRQGVSAALLEGRESGVDGAPVAFVCRGTACEMPARTKDALAATLDHVLRAIRAT